MGRPLNDRFFATVDGEGPDFKNGLQINLTLASYTGGPQNDSSSWIVRQRSPERYEVTNGTKTEVLRMFNGTGSIPAGRCALRVAPFEAGTEYTRTLTAHQVKTWQGNVYIWSHLQAGNAADEAGEVDFEPSMS